jgi:ribosomal protein S19E (S16A)
MNKAFTKSKEIVLDSNYKIISDSDSGVVLVFKTTKVNKKDEIVPYEEMFYYPRVAQALRKYADITLNTDLDNLNSNLEKVYLIINKIDKEFNQFN